MLALWGGLMGAFAGACLLAMAGAFLGSEVYGNFEGAAAMGGATIGGVVGAVAGFGGALWATLRNGGAWGGRAVAGATGAAIMMLVCLAFVAFS